MSRSAKVRRFFGDADYDFALTIGGCEELQELLDCGLHETQQQCAGISTRAILAVLRVGLIGGGLEKEAAYRLVGRHVVPGELAGCALLAIEVVNAAIAGVPDEPMGKAEGSGTGGPHSPEASSDTPTSTEQAARSGSARKRSRKPRSGA